MHRSRSLVGFFVVTVAAAMVAAESDASARAPDSWSGTAPRDLSAREQAVHVLNRLAFGPRPGEVDRVLRVGIDRWIDQQLHPDRIADPNADRLAAAYPDLALSAEELLREYPPPQALRAARGDAMTRADSMALRRAQQANRAFGGEIVSAKVARAVLSERELQEVMTDFWENHFTVFIGKGQQIRYFIPDYDRETIRPFALGRFRDLLGAVAKSPAMLFYLDNAQSVADSGRPTLSRGRRVGQQGGIFRPRRPGAGRLPGGRRPFPNGAPDRVAGAGTERNAERQTPPQAPQRRARGLNENYARELMELHTLGVDGGYTQRDVIEVARALTGWSIQPPRLGRSGFLFRPETHDAAEKIVLGHKLKAGRGMEDGEEVLDILARHPSTARFIARKLAVRFVSDMPPAALIDRAAATFTRTNGDIREVVRTIVTSPEFFARSAFRSKVKSPFEVTVSALRALGAGADTTPRTAGVVAFLGQPIFGHQAPNGWPETGEAWMNTGSILNRINFGLAVAASRIPGAELTRWPLYDSLARMPREAQVAGVIEALLGGRASRETEEILRSGSNPLLARDGAVDTADMLATDAGGDMRGDVRADDMSGGTQPRRRPQGELRPGQRGRAGGAGIGQIPPLNGLAQIVGLALGSPEFQRR